MTINLTDPANHPANEPLTVERIERVIEALESSLKCRNGSSMDHFIADAVKGLRELLESREAVPVACIDRANLDYLAEGCDGHVWAMSFAEHGDVPLYAAPPAPVALGDGRDQFEEWFKFHYGDEHSICKLYRANGGANYRDPHVDLAWIAWKDSRAAMLQAGNHTEQPLDMVDHFGNSNDMVKHQSNNQGSGDSGCGDEIKQPSSNQHVTQIKPVADLYGITSPTGSETSFTFDAVEARDFIDGGWSVQEYVELERYQEAMTGNSPVTPDGWIPVSERMPETDGNYWGWWSESKRQGPVWFIKSDLQAQFQSSEITHWQPLPAAPKEVG